MNLRVVGIPAPDGPINVRVVDLDTDDGDPMTADDRVLGPDGQPLGWADGRPTEHELPEWAS